MHALRNIHNALVPGGLLVDTQPVGPHPRVAAGGDELGTLDMRKWTETITAVDEQFDETIAARLYEQTHEQTLVIRDTFDDGPDCLETAGAWRGTRVPQPLADRLAAVRRSTGTPSRASTPVRVRVTTPTSTDRTAGEARRDGQKKRCETASFELRE